MTEKMAQPVDIEAQRRWLTEHRAASGASWTELAASIGIPKGTLSQFGSERGYNEGRGEDRIAEQVFRYRQLLASQARLSLEAPPVPAYYETETSNQLSYLLNWGQQGEVVVAALGPGTGKSQTARYYSSLHPNVIVATMSAAAAGVTDMLLLVLDALGVKNAKGTSLGLSLMVKAKLKTIRNALLIIDECQHLNSKAIDEIRSWNDLLGVGIALFGDEHLLARIEGDRSKLGLAQLSSRIGFRLVRSLPLPGDVTAMAAAWEIEDPALVSQLKEICSRRGGLRSGTKAIRLAKMLAMAQQTPLQLSHLRDAWAQLSSRAIAA